jgi:hypothetical protein
LEKLNKENNINKPIGNEIKYNNEENPE